MVLPLKALRKDQLKKKTEGPAVSTSRNKVITVEFTDIDGIEQIAFYKKISPDYSVALAKFSVASAVKMRALGDWVAEERLVFNKRGEIVGSVSIGLKNYKHLQFWHEPLPEDPSIRELVNPSVATLLLRDFMEVLALLYTMKDDDVHPGNLGVAEFDEVFRAVTLDRDMTDYPEKAALKGGRAIDFAKGSPEEVMKLLAVHLDNFPILDGRATHWPSNKRPMNCHFGKYYLASDAFRALAANPSIEIGGETVSAQELMFSAFLKQLLSWEPEMLRARYEDYFGDVPLDYQSLKSSKSKQKEADKPLLFNEDTNKESFVDYLMAKAREDYNELCRTVIFYEGCERNNSGVRVMGFSEFLNKRPSAFRKIRDWAIEENKRMEATWEKQTKEDKEQILKKVDWITKKIECMGGRASKEIKEEVENLEKEIQEDNHPVLSAHCTRPQGRYDEALMKKRYLKIWRDAYFPYVENILGESKQLLRDLGNKLQEVPFPLTKKEDISKTNASLTEAWQLLGEPDFGSEFEKIKCYEGNALYKGLKVLLEFHKNLDNCILDYYKLAVEELTPENNQLFLNKVGNIVQRCEAEFYPALQDSQLSIWTERFTNIATKLTNFCGSHHFDRHLRSQDNKEQQDFVAILARNHTDQEVIVTCLNTLFDWVNTLRKSHFDDYIKNVIKKSYKPNKLNMTSNRHRGKDVEEYLKSSHKEDNANRLATILSRGGCLETSLNTKLMEALIPHILDNVSERDVILNCVSKACSEGKFNARAYAIKAQQFVLKDSRFTHCHAKFKMEFFHNYMYQYVAELDKTTFKGLVFKALEEYEHSSLNPFKYVYSTKSRGSQIRPLFDEKKNKNLTNDKILAYIFSDGELTTTSYNPKLLRLILDDMKKSISADVKKAGDLGNSVILQAEIGQPPHCPLLNSLKEYAKPRTYSARSSTSEKRKSSRDGSPANLGSFAPKKGDPSKLTGSEPQDKGKTSRVKGSPAEVGTFSRSLKTPPLQEQSASVQLPSLLG